MRRLRALPIRSRSVLGLVGLLVALSACSASIDDLVNEAEGKAGVIDVSVLEEDVADNDIPFATIPKRVAVTMEESATQTEVIALFDSYGDAIDAGDVTSVQVTLEGPKGSTLSSGEGVRVTEQDVKALLDAHADDSVIEYRHDAWPDVSLIALKLLPTDIAGVVARADVYRGSQDLESVTVTSGDFALIYDEENDDLQITAAREALVLRLDSRFTLRGAVVSGRGPLEVSVPFEEVEALRQFLATSPADKVGKVDIRSAG